MLMVFGDFNNAMLSVLLVLLVYEIVCCFDFFFEMNLTLQNSGISAALGF